MRIALPLAGLLGATVLMAAAPARADIWARQDRQGVLYLTNIPPQVSVQGRGLGWKRIYRTGPGKAGALSGVSGRCNRADVIPAQDRSPERLIRFNGSITQAAALYQIPEALIHAVIKTESDYDPRVVSCTGAQGLMQLMPSAQKDMFVENVWDPHQNIMGGTRLLRTLANRFSGDLTLTIAGYHAGAAAVNKYKGVPPYETTQRYVQMVLKSYEALKARYASRNVPVPGTATAQVTPALPVRPANPPAAPAGALPGAPAKPAVSPLAGQTVARD